MKTILTILFFLSTVLVSLGQHQDICTHLQQTGRVSISQDSRLTDCIGVQPKTYYLNNGKAADSQTVMGYRIRVFSGNQQTASKNRCYSIQANINEQMPDLPTYVAFKTPNWRISVGDFRTSEEASSMLARLRRIFPSYANEMFIVQEKINL